MKIKRQRLFATLSIPKPIGMPKMNINNMKPVTPVESIPKKKTEIPGFVDKDTKSLLDSKNLKGSKAPSPVSMSGETLNNNLKNISTNDNFTLN